ncbi:hypothetical protein F5X98DRAFT_369139 [Xylaria grammica]|nr:hypothetical protein F5X98DRAFT_369139 [Xylaria grammica]
MHSLPIVFILVAMVSGTIADLIGPSHLRVTGKTNSSINGYIQACYASEGEEGLCYVEQIPELLYDWVHFYYNYTVNEMGTKKGMITFVQNVTGDQHQLTSAVQLVPSLGSNVDLAFIPIGIYSATVFSLGDDNKFYISNVQDDSYWNETKAIYGGKDMANFHLCWQWVRHHWWYSLAWTTTLPPQNPSCQPVYLELMD